jgi:hypothetical protein
MTWLPVLLFVLPIIVVLGTLTIFPAFATWSILSRAEARRASRPRPGRALGCAALALTVSISLAALALAGAWDGLRLVATVMGPIAFAVAVGAACAAVRPTMGRVSAGIAVVLPTILLFFGFILVS